MPVLISVLTLDLHAGQIQGFFDIPTDNLYAAPVMVTDIKENYDNGNLMVESPDVGGVVRARGLAKTDWRTAGHYRQTPRTRRGVGSHECHRRC